MKARTVCLSVAIALAVGVANVVSKFAELVPDDET
jgi:hypothetical protein